MTCEYIFSILEKSFITPFTSLLRVPVFYVKKKNRGFWFYVNYKGLNQINKKNKHPLPLI